MISNDVNVIFAYLDAAESDHMKSVIFVKNNNRRKYVLLTNVAKSFLKTYKDYILQVGDVIVNSVLQRKKIKSPIKNPSASHITKLIDIEINKELILITKEYEYSQNSLFRFKNLLLTEVSIPTLYFEEGAIGEFREKFITNSIKFSLNAMNKFMDRFPRFKLMKQSDYKKYDELLSLIKMKDYEDRKICTELFCFGTEKEKIGFLTFDKTFKDFLKKNGSEYNVKVLTR